MNKYLRIGLALTALVCSSPSLTYAASFPVIRESVIVCDPNAPQTCIKPAADGSISVTQSSANLATAQVTVAATSTSVVAARTSRSSLTVINLGTTNVFCAGTSGVTTSNGALLPGVAGASITLPYSGALYCIAATGTQAVSLFETF